VLFLALWLLFDLNRNFANLAIGGFIEGQHPINKTSSFAA
jgi:hypothetical protein